VTGGGHEKQHRKRQPERGSSGQIVPAHQAFGFRRHGYTLFRARAGPGDQALLNAPDHAPGIQQHDQAESASDADGEMRIRNVGSAVQGENQPGRRGHHQGNPYRANPRIIQDSLHGELQGVDENISDEPDEEPPAEPLSNELRVARKFCVGSEMDGVIAHPDKNGHERRPTEPAHRPRHQLRVNLDAQLRVALFHRGRQY